MDILDKLWEPHSWWETRHKVQTARELDEFFSDDWPRNKAKHFDIVTFSEMWVIRHRRALLYMHGEGRGFQTRFDFGAGQEAWLWSSRSNALISDDQVTELWQAGQEKVKANEL